MKCWVALAGAVLLASVTSAPALAGGGVYRADGWHSGRVWCHRAWYARCGCGCRVGLAIYYYNPARDYQAAYYNSRGGVGRGYSTTAYSTSGYPRHYAK